MKLYKLTDEKGQTHGGTQWGPGVTHEARPGDGYLCSPYWIHGYIDPLVAVFMNPIHANFKSPMVWEIEVNGDTKDDNGLKFGAKRVTTVRRVPLPTMTLDQRVTAAIYIARGSLDMVGLGIQEWESWADSRLDGSRPKAARAASSAADSAASAASAAASAADRAASSAADSAARAAWAAASAADRAAWAASSAADRAARAASSAAASAADSAAWAAARASSTAAWAAASAAASAADSAADSAASAASASSSAAGNATWAVMSPDEFTSLLILCLYAAVEDKEQLKSKHSGDGNAQVSA